jgi:hypothetical protein
MKLYDRGLVRRLRKAVKYQRKLAKVKGTAIHKRKFSVDRLWLRALLALIFLATFESVQANAVRTRLFLSLLAMFGAVEAVRRARQLYMHLTRSDERLLFQFYPLSGEGFFRLTIERRLIASLWIWGVAAVTYCVASGGEGPWILRGVAFATLTWLLSLCVMFLLVLKPEWLRQWVPASMYILFVILAAASDNLRPAMFQATSILPSGWANALFVWKNELGSWAVVSVGIPTAGAAAVWLLLHFRRRILQMEAQAAGVEEAVRPLRMAEELRSEMELLSVEDVLAREELLHEKQKTESEERSLEQWEKIRQERFRTEVAGYVESRAWLASWEWDGAPWIERLAAKTLNPQEKETLRYMLGGETPDWSSRWKMGVIAAGVSAALMALDVEATWALAGLALAISVGLGVPVLGGAWPLLGFGYIAGRLSPVYACLPFDFTRATKILIKTALVRAIAWLPAGLIVGGLMAATAEGTAGKGAEIMLRGFLIWTALLPVLAVGQFSKATNDTQDMRLIVVPLTGLAILFGLVLVIACGVAITAGRGWSALCIGGIALISGCSWLLYRRIYERGQIDLQRAPR